MCRRNPPQLQSVFNQHHRCIFQRVIRSFTRESGLMGDYKLEIDQEIVLEEVINDLIDELGSNKGANRMGG